jgi:hypothetical protein
MAAARGGSSGSGGSNKIIMLQAVKSETGNMALAVSMERRKLLLRAIVDTAQMVSLAHFFVSFCAATCRTASKIAVLDFEK